MVWRVLEVLCNALCNALDTDIPEGQISYQRPEGGYFVWVTFPPEVDCDKLSKVCMEKYLAESNYGPHSAASSGKFKNCMRLCFAFNECDAVEYSVRQIALSFK